MLYEKIREMNELGKLEVFNNYLLHIGKDIIYAKSKSTFENNGWYCVLDADGFEKYLVYHYDTGKKICVRFVDGKTPQIQEADPALPWFGEIIDVFSVLSFASDNQGNVIDIVQNALDDEAIKVNHLNTEEGDAVKLVGYDSEGNLVEDSIPEGITTDSVLNKESDNAIENAPVATALEDITADIYDATADYAVGDYCLHEWKLYKCNTAITGGEEWTADHWTLVNVSGELKLKADITTLENGTLVVSKALTAEEIAPVSEESGTIQDDPFISQGTGTENNTGSTDTSPVGKQLEKQGNSVAVNQLVQNPNFASASNWTCGGGTLSVSDNVATITASQQYCNLFQSIERIAGHKYLFIADVKLTTESDQVAIFVVHNGSNLVQGATADSTSWKTYTYILNQIVNNSTSDNTRVVQDNRTSDWDAIQTRNVYCIDLTQMFNGDIPQDLLDNPSHFSWYYNGSLANNAGTLKNSDGRYLVCTKRNLFDGELESGAISDQTGADVSASGYWRSKNKLPCVPNKPHYLKFGASAWVYWYDSSENFISATDAFNNNYKTAPSNAFFYRLVVYSATKPTAVTFSLYYTPEQGGEGYDQHYDYEEPKVYDTGIEELLRIPVASGDDVLDSKLPNGTITRRVGKIDLGTLTWTKGSTNFSAPFVEIAGAKQPSTSEAPKLFCAKLMITKSQGGVSGVAGTYEVYITQQGAISWYYPMDGIADGDAFATLMDGVYLYYELAEPTTEQGTTFSENIEIDDYGMMYWLDTDNNLVDVPQGVKLFYPAWYVGFVDSLYARTSGNATDVVVQSELTDSALAERGYQKVVDLSDGITILDSRNITSTVKKIYKIGNVVFVTATFKNETGATITTGTDVFTFASSIKPSVQLQFLLIGNNSITLNNDGQVWFNQDWENNTSRLVTITYAVA